MSIKTPLIPIYADVHMHTLHAHGVATVREMYAAACAKGLRYIGFSEHSPRPQGYTYQTDYQEYLAVQFPLCMQEIVALQKEVGADVQILFGLEADYIKEEKDYVEKICNAYAYDYIIGGLHFQGNWGFDGPAVEWENKNERACFAIYKKYYEDLKSMCASGFFQVIAHPDLIKIHSKKVFDAWLTTFEAKPLITDALQVAKEQGMAMEVSSAGLRKNCAEIYPGAMIMDIAAKLQLPISFGSDAHCTNTVAYAFDVLARYASSFGYTKHTIFINKTAKELLFTVPDLL